MSFREKRMDEWRKMSSVELHLSLNVISEAVIGIDSNIAVSVPGKHFEQRIVQPIYLNFRW